jgi:two-component system chemotaxis response regulator CheB
MNPAPQPGTRLEVLVVDDSPLARQLMLGVLEQAGMKVQCAADPVLALEWLQSWCPDVIVLDLEMPRMDGLTFLRVLSRRNYDIPVVVCSGVAGQRSVIAMKALHEGAVDIVTRPRIGLQQFFRDSHVLLSDAIAAAAQVRRSKRRPQQTPARSAARPAMRPGPGCPRVVAIGASTGGTEALHEILQSLPADSPPVLIAQHMPQGFTAAFAAWLDDQCAVCVREAASGDRLVPGTVLVAPGGSHLTVREHRDGLVACVNDGPLVARHRPSVDVLFDSVARTVGRGAVGAVLTGMGDDGSKGLLALRAAGALTIAQDEATSVVYGMPKAAVEAGAVDLVLPLHEIGAALLWSREVCARKPA